MLILLIEVILSLDVNPFWTYATLNNINDSCSSFYLFLSGIDTTEYDDIQTIPGLPFIGDVNLTNSQTYTGKLHLKLEV